MTRKDLENILYADLGSSFDPQRALDFLRILERVEVEGKRPTTLLASKRLEKLFENPPEKDTTLLVIYKTQYVLGEIVMAGKETQSQYPITKFHPIHFKKTYLEKFSRWENSPMQEAEISQLVWAHFQTQPLEREQKFVNAQGLTSKELTKPYPKVPLPLGADPKTYRSEILEARTLGALSPISNTQDPPGLAKQIHWARKNFQITPELWEGIHQLFQETDFLHSGGFLHNDLHRENLLIRYEKDNKRPTGCLIDFETTTEDDRFKTSSWERACQEDKRQLLEEASLIYLCQNANSDKKGSKSSAVKNLTPDEPLLHEPLPPNPLVNQIIQHLESSPKMLSIQKELKKVGNN